MKRIIYIVILITFFFLFNVNLKALTYGGCEYSEISKLKSFVSNINLTYDYYIENNEAYFNLTITNLTPELYFVDSYTGNKYSYYDSNDGELTIYGIRDTKGNLKFYSAREECYGVSLNSKYYNFPSYNTYSTDPLCIQKPNHTVCKKWIKINYSYSEFKEIIENYQEKTEEKNDIIIEYDKGFMEKVIEFYLNNYYIILPIIIVISYIVMLINKKKNSFKI